MEHQEYEELLALHALDALDASEARSLEEHLSTCAECRDELIELRDAASLLAHASTTAAPRDEIRARIIAAAHSETREGRTTTSELPAQVVPLPRRTRTSLWPNLLKLAAAIAFVALIIGIVVLWRSDVRSRQEIARLSRQVSTQQHELTRERDARVRERDAIALLSSPGAKKIELAGTQTAQNARAMFVFDQQTGRAVLLTEGLPVTPADKAYELWFIPKDHSPMPGKMFAVDATGRAMVSDQVPPEAREHSVIAITLEPKRGSAVPTGAIYLSSPSS